MLDNERSRARWDAILLLAERLSPVLRLIPASETARSDMFGLANSICGEDGFGCNFRLYKMAAWESALAGESSEPVFLTREQVDVMQRRMPDAYRQMGEAMERELDEPVDPILIDHRDAMLEQHFSVPLRF